MEPIGFDSFLPSELFMRLAYVFAHNEMCLFLLQYTIPYMNPC